MKKLCLSLLVMSLLIVGCGMRGVVAKITGTEGEVSTRNSGSAPFVKAQPGLELAEGGAVRTGKDGKAVLEDLARKGRITVDLDSYYEVRMNKSVGWLEYGKALFDIIRQEEEIVIETPHGNTAVLGTVFGQVVASDSFELWVEKGKVEFTAKNGQKRTVSANQKLIWKVNEELPEAVNFNLPESEAFFGAKSSRPSAINPR